jgi:hypothetical protein
MTLFMYTALYCNVKLLLLSPYTKTVLYTIVYCYLTRYQYAKGIAMRKNLTYCISTMHGKIVAGGSSL